MQRFIVIVLLLLTALLPLAALPVAVFVLAVPLIVAASAPVAFAGAPPLPFVALTTSRAPPSR